MDSIGRDDPRPFTATEQMLLQQAHENRIIIAAECMQKLLRAWAMCVKYSGETTEEILQFFIDNKDMLKEAIEKNIELYENTQQVLGILQAGQFGQNGPPEGPSRAQEGPSEASKGGGPRDTTPPFDRPEDEK